MESGKYDYLIKFALIGESYVGKTCILDRFTKDRYIIPNYKTVGKDLGVRLLNIDGKVAKVATFDTVPIERHNSNVKPMYKQCQGIIFVYDVTVRGFFDQIGKWIETVSLNSKENVCRVLVASKCDAENREVTFEEGQALAEKLGIRFFEVSAKEGINIDEAFSYLGKEVLNSFESECSYETINLARKEGKKGCCLK